VGTGGGNFLVFLRFLVLLGAARLRFPEPDQGAARVLGPGPQPAHGPRTGPSPFSFPQLRERAGGIPRTAYITLVRICLSFILCGAIVGGGGRRHTRHRTQGRRELTGHRRRARGAPGMRRITDTITGARAGGFDTKLPVTLFGGPRENKSPDVEDPSDGACSPNSATSAPPRPAGRAATVGRARRRAWARAGGKKGDSGRGAG